MIGKVVGDPWVARVKNGTGKALFLQVKIGGGSDVRTVQYMPQAGEDTVPIKGCTVALVDVGGILIAVSSYDGILSEHNPGEKEIYSSDGTQKLARFVLKRNGAAYLGNGPTGKNLRATLEKLIQGIQGLKYIPYPGGVAGPPVAVTDSTGKVAGALTDLASFLDGSPI